MTQKAFRVVNHAQLPSVKTPATGTVVPFRQKLLPRHQQYLAQWLQASEKMGILDASIENNPLSSKSAHNDQIVVIWVRENADPAYIIRPQGHVWCLIDCLRDNELGRFTSLSMALYTIRPVLPPLMS